MSSAIFTFDSRHADIAEDRDGDENTVLKAMMRGNSGKHTSKWEGGYDMCRRTLEGVVVAGGKC